MMDEAGRVCSLTFTDMGDGMKKYYQAELETAVERLRATMAAADSWELRPCILPKGKTLYIKAVRPVRAITRGTR